MHFFGEKLKNKTVVGFVVTIIAGICSYPLDTVMRRIMMTSGEEVKYEGIMDCEKKIVKKEGWKTLYNGALISIMTGVGSVIAMMVIHKLKK